MYNNFINILTGDRVLIHWGSKSSYRRMYNIVED